MANNDSYDLRELLIDAHAHFFFFKGMGPVRVRLWQILKDSIVIDVPKGAPMRKTMLGYIPTVDNLAVYEIEGTVCVDETSEQMPNTLRIIVDAEKIKKVSRRQFPRVSFTPPIEANLKTKNGKKSISGRIVNLSAGGLRVETSEELSPTETYSFNFEVLLVEDIHELNLTGTVLYELPSTAGHAYGIKFVDEKAGKKAGEASVEDIDKTVDLLSLVNKLILEKTVS